MWSKGILIAKAAGIALIILGVASCFGLITIYDTMMDMNKKMQTTKENSMIMPQDKIRNEYSTLPLDKVNATMHKKRAMSPEMDM